MTVHPLVRLGLWALPRVPTPPMRSLADYRAWDAKTYRVIHALTATPPSLARISAHRVPVAGGEVLVRVYRPHGQGPFGGHVFGHGGAFWLGSVDSTDPLCRAYSAHARRVVVSVGYRLAPEHPFPVPVEDFHTAYRWVLEHAAALEVDKTRVSVGGVSAGAGLAAATTLLARERGTAPPTAQVLEIPFLDCTLDTARDTGFGLSTVELKAAADLYTGGDEATARAASPALAQDLRGLPPTLVTTCEYDALRGTGEAYARRLAEAGVEVSTLAGPGHIHGSSYLTRFMPSARRYVDGVVAFLRERADGHGGGGGGGRV
ncbi:acetyl esterase [Crossiella equi]|uniref:Acetyl esterase n=1 Tax=Crossiella equi TaxID=130796 RepID=A0ABS5A7Q3_9PSEU|nr:alpha/beta hydrolase [Crossiella equi]MBP2472621.1 acetyl esterase [Crossiella equi]